MTDIFREVEEDVRRERFEKLWKQYGHLVIAGVAALVLAVGGYQFWKHYEQTQREENAATYMEAIRLAESGKPLDAAAKFEDLSKNGTSGYRQLAKVAQGDALLSANKPQDAVSAYKEAVDDGSNKELSDVARIRAAWIMVETTSQGEVRSVLGPLTDASSVWRFMAQEILAYSDFIAGQSNAAQQAYEKLAADASAPAGVRSRARVMAQFLTSGGSADYGTVPPPAKPEIPKAADATQPTITTAPVKP